MRVTDKIISVDAAKLLGLPFTWGLCAMACRFVHTGDGPRLLGRGITPEGVRDYGTTWAPADALTNSIIGGFESGDRYYDLFVVEEDPDAGNR